MNFSRFLSHLKPLHLELFWMGLISINTSGKYSVDIVDAVDSLRHSIAGEVHASTFDMNGLHLGLCSFIRIYGSHTHTLNWNGAWFRCRVISSLIFVKHESFERMRESCIVINYSVAWNSLYAHIRLTEQFHVTQSATMLKSANHRYQPKLYRETEPILMVLNMLIDRSLKGAHLIISDDYMQGISKNLSFSMQQ